MPLPKLLQKALTALLRTVELTADPKQAVQIIAQHFTLSRHELVKTCQDSYEQALTTISLGLGQPAPLAAQMMKELAQEVVQETWEAFARRQVGAGRMERASFDPLSCLGRFERIDVCGC